MNSCKLYQKEIENCIETEGKNEKTCEKEVLKNFKTEEIKECVEKNEKKKTQKKSMLVQMFKECKGMSNKDLLNPQFNQIYFSKLADQSEACLRFLLMYIKNTFKSISIIVETLPWTILFTRVSVVSVKLIPFFKKYVSIAIRNKDQQTVFVRQNDNIIFEALIKGERTTIKNNPQILEDITKNLTIVLSSRLQLLQHLGRLEPG